MHNVIPLFSPCIDRGRQVLVCAPGDRTSGLFPFFDDLREWRSQAQAFAADPSDVRNQTVRHDAFAQGNRFQVIPCFVRRFDPLPRRRVTVALHFVLHIECSFVEGVTFTCCSSCELSGFVPRGFPLRRYFGIHIFETVTVGRWEREFGFAGAKGCGVTPRHP